LILFYELLRPSEIYKIEVRDGSLIKEKEGFVLRVKTKSSLNAYSFIFIPLIEDKRICVWEALFSLREYNKEIFAKNGLISLRYLVILIKLELIKI
jgi:hypothetical protein